MAHSNDLTLPPLALLPAVLAAARSGSFSAAATEMNVTHSVISR
ncbi:MAG TPA: transcriptional regulator, partial [Thalassospira lucentensis]|nr:transcriptional regulator [Thalassospira lucentensis]